MNENLINPTKINISPENTNITNMKQQIKEPNSNKVSNRRFNPLHSNRIIINAALFFLILSLILVALFAYSITLIYRARHNEDLLINRENKLLIKKNTCKSTDCYKAANFILDNLNQSVNPCNNFFQFSCGAWVNRHSVEEEEDKERDQFSLAYEKMLQDISDILKEDIDPDRDSTIVQNFKNFYASCTNKHQIEYKTDYRFLEYMRNEFSDWPMLLSVGAMLENKPSVDLEDHLAKLTTLRMPLLFRFESDDYNHTQILFKILLPEDFCLLQKFLPNVINRNERAFTSFFNLVKNIQVSMLESLNISTKMNTNFDDQISEMLKLANKLYFLNDARYRCGIKKSTAQSEMDRTNNVLKISELDDRIKSNATKFQVFDIKKYINYLNKHTGTSNKLNENTTVVISNLAINYLKDLIQGLGSNQNESFRQAFLNFLYFHTLFSLIKPLNLFKSTQTLSQIVHVNVLLPIKYYHLFFEYSKHVNNVTPLDNLVNMFKLNREHSCAFSVIETFSVVDSMEQIELQRLFLSRKFSPNSKNMADEMLAGLINTTHKIIDTQHWIDADTKATIKFNLNQMEYKTVHANSLFTESFADLAARGKYTYTLINSYLVNVLELRRAFFNKELDLHGVEQAKRIRNNKYIFDIFLANLMYLKDFNTLLMPAGVLVEPIFNYNNPIYLNFATIGTYMSHEIWHAIHEDLLLTSSNTTKYNYMARLNCLVNNYYQYTKKKYGLDIDGEISSSEQIADNFGILVSFKTFVSILGTGSGELKNFKFMPGLDYDQQQIFFIRYAQSYCRKAKLYSLYDFHQYHVINEFRAFQVSLIPEFFPVFKCDLNYKEAEIKPCKIFDF